MKIEPTATPKINCKTPGCTEASPHTNMGTFVIPAKFMIAVPEMTRATMEPKDRPTEASQSEKLVIKLAPEKKPPV